MVLPEDGPRLDGGGDTCYTHRKKEVMGLKKRLAALAVLFLGAGFLLSSLAWQRAERQAADWRARAEDAERRAAQAEAALETAEDRRHLLALEDDPIAAFFSSVPYSGAAAGYLASLEADAYRAEMENAAKLLENGETGARIPAFLSLVDTQAQSRADAWAASLEAQGASTAGAWANMIQCRIPIYRFGAYTLISACRRTGQTYSYLFDPETTRQTLLEAGFRKEDLPAAGHINK